MPAIPSCIIDPIWDQFAELLPEKEVEHPLGCHNPRIPDRVVFDKLACRSSSSDVPTRG
jgi:hypothetical protein